MKEPMALRLFEGAVERMARAGAKDSLPRNGMFNSDQLDAMLSERMPAYKHVAEVMLEGLLSPE